MWWLDTILIILVSIGLVISGYLICLAIHSKDEDFTNKKGD